MTAFKLNSTTKVPGSNEDMYTYDSAEGGFLKFSAHPRQAFVWVIHGTNLKTRQRNKLLNAFVEAGMDRGERSFEQAISVLEI